MSKTKILAVINNKIDMLIIADKIQTAEYERLVKLHYLLTR